MIASIHDRDMASASYPRRGTQGDAYEILMSMCATSVEPAIAQVNVSCPTGIDTGTGTSISKVSEPPAGMGAAAAQLSW